MAQNTKKRTIRLRSATLYNNFDKASQVLLFEIYQISQHGFNEIRQTLNLNKAT